MKIRSVLLFLTLISFLPDSVASERQTTNNPFGITIEKLLEKSNTTQDLSYTARSILRGIYWDTQRNSLKIFLHTRKL
jgi:hypothetical protein